MKKLLASLITFYSLNAFSATVPPIDVSFDLDSQPLTQVMKLIYIQALPERPYFLDPALLQDQRIISFRYTHKDGDFRPFFNTFLHELGYTLDVKNGADFIKPTPNTETLGGFKVEVQKAQHDAA